jgi:chaperonin GroEL (HSP60 family)
MSISYSKPKSVGKVMIPKGDKLSNIVLDTLKTCSDLVGSTLGPGGMSVVIERQEVGLPPTVTKDGVTVFKSLGFEDSASHRSLLLQ